MNIEQVKQAIESTPKCSNIVIEWTRDAKTRKGVTDSIQKSVRMIGRIGIEYDNLKAVKIGRATDELPAENQGLPWGRFEIYPYLIEHKGNHYVRLYKGTSKIIRPKTTWFKNGVEVERDEISPLLLKSELKSSKGECFVTKIESITRLNQEIELEFEPVEAERVEVENGVAEPV